MKANVIIPTYNKLSLLRQTLASLEKQVIDCTSFQTIVTDDCSSDGTREFLEQYSGPLSLKPVFHHQNQGRAAARNAALNHADGDIIVFLDDDMEATSDFIAAHLSHHTGDENIAVIGNAVTSSKITNTVFTRYLDHTGVHRLQTNQAIPFKYFTSNNSSVSKKILDRVGYFNENFSEYGGEDTELGYRLSKAGVVFRYAPLAKSYHLHYKEYQQVCRQLNTYGRTMLYHLYCQYPDFRQSVFWFNFNVTAKLPLKKLLYSVFDYLLSYSYLDGIRDKMKSQSRVPHT
jgi:glycosyltransferase involved in cell wall biosynthesis